MEKYIANVYVEDFNEDLYMKLQEDAYDEAMEIYRKVHDKEMSGLAILEKLKDNIDKQIYYQKCKWKFVNSALKGKRKEVINLDSFIPSSISDKSNIVLTIKKHLFNKRGKDVAFLLIVWQEIGYLTIPEGRRSALYDCIRNDFSYEIGTNQSIDKYLIKSIGKLKEKRKYAYWEDEKIEEGKRSVIH